MRRSKTVSLLLCSSLAIFGLGHITGCDEQPTVYSEEDEEWDGWEPAPIYIDGMMGVYHPHTHIFVPMGSPGFSSTCTLIRSTHIASVRATGYSSVRGGFGSMGGKSGIAS